MHTNATDSTMNQTIFTRSSLFQPRQKIVTAAEEAHQQKQIAKRRVKRARSLWKDRVAPISSEKAKKNNKTTEDEDIIDEAILTRCTRCPPHRNRTGRFRPLIGNDGEYLCDDCYQREFPATAMLDDVDQTELQRKTIHFANKLRNTIVDHVADFNGTTQPNSEITRENAMKNNNDSFPSEVECRMCLDRGVFRRCCSSYYCHLCFYKSGLCPGCEIEVPLTGIAAGAKPDPGKMAVGISWVLSALIVALALVGLALFYWNASTSPVTVWGHVCRGWFPVCDLAVCVDYDGGNGYGEGNEWIPAAQHYRVCNRSLTSNQVVGSACVYDKEMYVWSNFVSGYDICVSSPREENTRMADISSPNPLLLFSGDLGGVYVFDDDFELPQRETSAPWLQIINGNSSDACGVNLMDSPERGNHGGFKASENKNALVFTGVQVRHAATKSLNIENGGRLDFYLKLGPISSDDAACKTAFGGDVTLEYSIIADQWETFGVYPAWKYRGEYFQPVSEEVPPHAWTNSTQFRFRQVSFDSMRDHWALDDVRIFANFQPMWQESVEFKQRQKLQNKDVKLAQCCYNTDQCSVFDKKRMDFDEEECRRIPNFDKSNRSLRLRSSELLIVFSFLAAATKTTYHRFARRLTHLARRNRSNTTESFQTNTSEMFPRRTFYSSSDLTWQYLVTSILGGALMSTIYRLVDSLMIVECLTKVDPSVPSCQIDHTFIIACLLALFFDLRAIKILLTEVFVVEHPCKPKSVEVFVDTHPDKGIMCVDAKKIQLANISGFSRQSSSFFVFLSLCYILGGMPHAMAMLTMTSFHLPASLEACAQVLGFLAVLREVFGPGLFAKAFLTVGWILAIRQDDRDEFGRALLRRGLLQQAMIGMSVTPIIVLSTILSRRVGDVNPGYSWSVLGLCVAFGGLFGALVGIVRGLPCDSISIITGFPNRACYTVTYYDKAHCPCLFSCNYCGEIHSRQMMLVVALDDILTFKKMLTGNLNNMH